MITESQNKEGTHKMSPAKASQPHSHLLCCQVALEAVPQPGTCLLPTPTCTVALAGGSPSPATVPRRRNGVAALGKHSGHWAGLLCHTWRMVMPMALQDYPFVLQLFLEQTYGEEIT